MSIAPRERRDKYGLSPMQEAALFRARSHLSDLMEGVYRPEPNDPNHKRLVDIIANIERLLGY